VVLFFCAVLLPQIDRFIHNHFRLFRLPSSPADANGDATVLLFFFKKPLIFLCGHDKHARKIIFIHVRREGNALNAIIYHGIEIDFRTKNCQEMALKTIK
jgi:hypothetical protein